MSGVVQVLDKRKALFDEKDEELLAGIWSALLRVFPLIGFAGAPGLLQQPWAAARTFYESGRDIGDEYRYILDRQAEFLNVTEQRFVRRIETPPGPEVNRRGVSIQRQKRVTQPPPRSEPDALRKRRCACGSVGGCYVIWRTDGHSRHQSRTLH